MAPNRMVSDAQGVITFIFGYFTSEPSRKPQAGTTKGGAARISFWQPNMRRTVKPYLTAFHGSYGPDAFEPASSCNGLGFTLLGMIGAVPLLRQRNQRSRRLIPGKPQMHLRTWKHQDEEV